MRDGLTIQKCRSEGQKPGVDSLVLLLQEIDSVFRFLGD
jgi:hypothetical protein